MGEILQTYFMITVLFGGLALFVGANIYIMLNPHLKKGNKKKQANISTEYRDKRTKDMYKRLARSEEREARLENEIRDRLKNNK